jgi:hypothetical protein
MYPLSTRIEESGLLVLKQTMPLCVPIAILMVIGLLILTGVLGRLNENGAIGRLPPLVKAAYCSVVVLLIVMFLPDNSQPFIYFQF